MRVICSSIVFGILLAFSCLRPTDGNWISKDRSSVFKQQLNHLNKADGTFDQRYWYENKYYKADGPVFLFISGESDPTGSDMNYAMCDLYAHALNASCLLLEHRYYGESAPQAIRISGNYPAGTFKFLNSGQAVEDVGSFIEWMKKHSLESNLRIVISPKSKWVVFGCSYGGTLAAWAKGRFPDLIHAAVVSSAPMEAKLDWVEFVRRPSRLRFHQGTLDAAWDYQRCTEFGWFHVDPKSDLLTNEERVRIVESYCSKFNENITLAWLEQVISNINQRWLGKNFYQERVIIVHGSDDDWLPAGISSPNPDPVKQSLMPIVIIPFAKHCEDIKFPPNPQAIPDSNWGYPTWTDFVQLRQNIEDAQNQILRIIEGWLRLTG